MNTDLSPTLETCHDVRHLRACRGCSGLGDKRSMIQIERGKSARHYHGRCYIASHGMTLFLRLPKEETEKLTLNDIGSKAMKALLKRHYD